MTPSRQRCGVRPTLMRPPYGSITAGKNTGFTMSSVIALFLWDVDPLDWKRPGPKVVTNRIVKETHSWLDRSFARYSSRND